VETFVANKQVCEKLPCWHFLRQSAPCAFERMMHICFDQHGRC